MSMIVVPLGVPSCVSMAKNDRVPGHIASREKSRGVDPELSLDLGGHQTIWS
jgi:hypothetical protein